MNETVNDWWVMVGYFTGNNKMTLVLYKDCKEIIGKINVKIDSKPSLR